MTIAIEIGSAAAGTGGSGPALLDLEELLATRLLVQGNSGSGKSHLLRRLLEQSAPHVQQVVIDPEGEFASLSERFGHVVIDADRSLAELEHIAGRVRQHRVSAVLNLESLDAELQMRAAAAFLNALFEADRDHWYPMLVVVDEAQLLAPAIAGDVSEEARRLSLGAMTNLMCRGRKRGLAGIIATQRLAKLAKNVAAEASNFLMGRTFLDIDMARAADLLGLERRQAETFRELERGHFVALGPALSRRPLPVRVGPVETQPRSGIHTLTPLPEQPAGQARDLLLSALPSAPARPSERRAPPPPPPSTHDLLEQMVRTRPAAGADSEAAQALPAEERRRLVQQVAQEILREPGAAFRSDAALYQDFQVRCRILKAPQAVPALAEFRLQLHVARGGIAPDAADFGEWAGIAEVARQVPQDLQAVFLVLAAAALRALPCPGDREVAARCGFHSPGRVKSQVRNLVKGGFLADGADLRGLRTIGVPAFGWRTAPGDPNAGPAARDEDRGMIAAE